MSEPAQTSGAREDEGAEEAGGEPAPIPRPTAWYRWPFYLLRRLYRWTLAWADSRYAIPALFVLAFVEASFFPIPPDVLLMAMAFGKRSRAFLYAAVTTLGSVMGAFLGWYIGVGLWASFGVHAECSEFGGGAWLFEHVPSFSCHNFEKVRDLYHDNAWLALFTAAFTPIPFKVFTIAAGVFRVGLATLFFASLVGRGARFFLVTTLIYFFGRQVRGFIEKRFEVVTVAFTVLLVAGFVLIKYVL